MFKLFIILLLTSACSKKESLIDKAEKILEDKVEIEKELWKIKIISLEKISETRDLKLNKTCEKYSATFNIELQETCYQDKNFLEHNVITNYLLKAIKQEDKAYSPGVCYTERDVEQNLANLKAEAMGDVGSTICVSRDHVLAGNKCKKEVLVTKEIIDQNMDEIAKQAKLDLQNQTKHEKGIKFLDQMDLDICH